MTYYACNHHRWVDRPSMIQVRGKRFLTRPVVRTFYLRLRHPLPLPNSVNETDTSAYNNNELLADTIRSRYKVVGDIHHSSVRHVTNTSVLFLFFSLYIYIYVCVFSLNQLFIFYVVVPVTPSGQLMTWPRPTHITYYIHIYIGIRYSTHIINYIHYLRLPVNPIRF